MAVKNNSKKTSAKSRTANSKSKLSSLPKVNKWLALLFVAVVAGVGAYIIYRANAATNNCQLENSVQICDVDMALGNDVTVLSTKGWSESLGQQGFWYFGAVFRAPTTSLAGAVPVNSVYNASTTYRDYMTTGQKALKDSAFPGKTTDEGTVFYAWEQPGQPNTVPVYRITQGGDTTKTFFSTDLGTINRLLAEDQNNPNGWKKDQFAGSGFVAFYAYPPNYAVAKQPNPYDCSIQANFVSERCTGPREALVVRVEAGDVPVGNDCPASLAIYQKAPFASQFDQACQDKWNSYMNDCTVQENFVSDRCKQERQAFIDAEAEQARLRAQAAAAQKAASAAPTARGGGGGGGGGSAPRQPNATNNNTCNAQCVAWSTAVTAANDEAARLYLIAVHEKKWERAATAVRNNDLAGYFKIRESQINNYVGTYRCVILSEIWAKEKKGVPWVFFTKLVINFDVKATSFDDAWGKCVVKAKAQNGKKNGSKQEFRNSKVTKIIKV